MTASFSSGSSFTSSSHSRHPTYSRSYTSPVNSTWTSTSGVSTSSAPSTRGSMVRQSPLQTLDIGAPGFQATITLYPDTAEERTVYLGPWRIVEGESRRIQWECSYENEVLEHYFPSDEPSESYPHSRHSKHRKYHDPSDMERHLTFTEPSRIRYIDDDGNCVHDQYVTINYEFTTVDAAVKFQGDIRQKDMIAFFDLNLAWTNVHDLKNSYGHVTGIATVQRLKLWRDRSTFAHSITIYAKKTDGYREYNISSFHHELRRDEKKCQLHLNAPGGRRSSSDTTASKRKLSLPKLKRGLTSSSQQSTSSAASASASTSNSTSHSSANQNSDLDIRFLALEFTEREDYRRFLEHWTEAYELDCQSHATPFSQSHSQQVRYASEADPRRLNTVQEPTQTTQRHRNR